MLAFNDSDFGLLDLTAFSESTIVATSPSIRYNLGDVVTTSTTRSNTAGSAVGASVAMGLGALGLRLRGGGGGGAVATTTTSTMGVNHMTTEATTTRTTTLAAAVAATVATTTTTTNSTTTTTAAAAVATTAAAAAAAELPPAAVEEDIYIGFNEDVSLPDELLAPFLDLSNITSDLGYSGYDVLNSRGWKAAIVTVYVLVIAVGVVGNLLAVYVILRNRRLRGGGGGGVTNVFLVTLALCDVVLCLFNLPFQLHYQLTDNWFFGRWLCHVIVPTFSVPLHVSTASILAISVNRYLLLLLPPSQPPPPPAAPPAASTPSPGSNHSPSPRRPTLLSLPFGRCLSSGGGGGVCSPSTAVSSSLLHPSSSSPSSQPPHPPPPPSPSSSRHRTAVLVVAAILVFSFVPTIPLIAFANLYAIPDASANTHFVYCGEAWPSVTLRRVYRAGMFALQFCVPLLVSAAVHLRIHLVLEQCAAFKKQHSSNSSSSARRKRTDRALAAILVVFAVCWFPWNTFVLLDEFDYEVVRGKYFKLIDLLLKIFAISSACVKPVLYAWLNGNFRKELAAMLSSSGGGRSCHLHHHHLHHQLLLMLGCCCGCCSGCCGGGKDDDDDCLPTKEGHTLLEPTPSSTMTRASMTLTENTTTDFC